MRFSRKPYSRNQNLNQIRFNQPNDYDDISKSEEESI